MVRSLFCLMFPSDHCTCCVFSTLFPASLPIVPTGSSGHGIWGPLLLGELLALPVCDLGGVRLTFAFLLTYWGFSTAMQKTGRRTCHLLGRARDSALSSAGAPPSGGSGHQRHAMCGTSQRGYSMEWLGQGSQIRPGTLAKRPWSANPTKGRPVLLTWNHSPQRKAGPLNLERFPQGRVVPLTWNHFPRGKLVPLTQNHFTQEKSSPSDLEPFS